MGNNSSILASNSERVLIFMDSEDESQAIAMTLSRNGCAVVVCTSTPELCDEIADGVGVVALSRHTLEKVPLSDLCKSLIEQPAWSHLPILVINHTSESPSAQELEELGRLGNLISLDAPFRLGTLVTAVRSAIAYRRRQYQTRDLMEQLETSRREAVEANRAKSDFLANMSHEIRTPLGAVLGFSELLMEAGISERERQVYMTTVRRNGQLLSALIDDILDLAKVESGRIELDRIEFSLTELLSDVVSVLEPKASRKGLPLIVERDAATPETISSDPIRIKQILTNIIGNAIKFTSHGSITVRIDGGEPEGDSPSRRLRIEV